MISGLIKNIRGKVVLVHQQDLVLSPELETIEELCSLDVRGREGLVDEVCEAFGIEISSLPVVLVYGEIFGLEDIDKIEAKIKAKGEEELEAAKELVRKEKRVVFIKGTPDQPQCRFTRQLLQILAEVGLQPSDYVSVNILASQRVREGMKEYANWPTYPQIYIDHEFVGGLDVLKGEQDKGTLAQYLKLSLD
ncbi:monothiol glutaredoxin [Nematocida homosporus]|uniref:monothiol glutaredoxin n=1 Tax=Nematocida homosporus TaxID=1912981 RepID=UPI00221E8A1D|nr:monothiol glutaredoxin [Nematocida homosporus]KAI5186091.1 monothiol glutaredoxin [Nematocida homosporus]